MQALRKIVAQLPIVGPIARAIYRRMHGGKTSSNIPFSSEAYWESRYKTGGTSGAGSYGRLAQFKAEVLNQFVESHEIQSVIEFGCGDGNQLSLARYPCYLGIDVSKSAVLHCRERFAGDRSKEFALASDYTGEKAELALSLDVVFHLTEDRVFVAYMERLFNASARFVVVYSSDVEPMETTEPFGHFRHRNFSRWVAENKNDWELIRKIPNRYPYIDNEETESVSDFFVYGKK